MNVLFERLRHSRFGRVPHCASKATAGIDEVPEWQVWVDQPTTPDQLHIETYLNKVIHPGMSILHIGLGNSSLAKKFCPAGVTVVGTTIHEEEVRSATSLAMENYTAVMANKYDSDMDSINDEFSFIVDNNPASFCCCLSHFCRMWLSYKRLLQTGGSILTAEPGLSWVISHGDANWGLNWDDWTFLAAVLDLSPKQVDTFVYAMERRK